ncbi:MAG TPA: ABC transporter ATP-binding protein [Vicinamibacterales bacterium]
MAIRVENLVKTYGRGRGQTRAVAGISFEVARGAIFGLLGPNGAGKTTTLRVLTTLVRPTSGRASVLGFDVVEQPLEVRRRIGVVIQEQAAELLLNVRDNLLTFARFHGRSGDAVRQRADEVMARLQLEEVASRKVQDLSGGARRRVQVAKMFLVDVPVVFLDEFSAGMDPILKRTVIELVRSQAAQGRTFVLTTHILSEAEELCDDILIIDRGREIARGDVPSLRLLADRIYDVALTFEAMPPDVEVLIAPYAPLSLAISGRTIRLRVKDEGARVLELTEMLGRHGRVLGIEVNGASLEDVFVDLTQRAERS